MKRQIKIAMLGSFPPLRGISSYCLELATSIADRNFQIEFISFNRIYPQFLYPGNDLVDDNTFPAIDQKYLSVKRKLNWYDPSSWILESLRSKADLLHLQWWSLPLWPIYLAICIGAKIRCRPIVFTVHNVLSHEKNPIFLHLSQKLFAFGDHFIIHTAVNQKQLMDIYGISSHKISRIAHGPLDFQVNPNASRKKIRSEFGFSTGHKVILLFGTLRAYKGIDTAIEAFSKVRLQIPEARLLIAGKPWQSWAPYGELVKRYALEDDIICDLRYIPSEDIHRHFTAADLVILPYHHFDSQTGVGAAAVSFRKPMIVSQVGGLPELVLDRRAVVPPKNPNALATAISDCLTDPERLSKMARDADEIAQKISWASIAKQTTRLYEKLLNNRRGIF